MHRFRRAGCHSFRPPKTQNPAFAGHSLAERVGFEGTKSPRIDGVSGGYESAHRAIGGVSVRNAEGLDQGLDQRDEVERALAFAIVEATKAGQWAIVAQLAKELEARRSTFDSDAVRAWSHTSTSREERK
jgi:hypothetical protein